MPARPVLRRLALPLLALVAGCAPVAGARVAPDPVAATARLEPAAWTPSSPPAEIAAWVRRGCEGLGPSRAACVEGALLRALPQAGVAPTMAALEALAAGDASLRNDGHVLAHGIGIAAYADPATVGETFGQCTPSFQSGCYHGVIQAYFADARVSPAGAGPTAEALNALCASYRTEAGRWIQFHCAHGVGHGLMAVHDHHLLKALDGCDAMTDAMERESCYGGAYMENIVNVTHPHHTETTRGHAHGGGDDAHAGHGAAEGHAGHGGGEAHAGHGAAGEDHAAHAEHGAHAAAEPWVPLKRDEPLWPCTAVKEAHRMSCYLMQTSPILYFNGGDFAAAGRACEQAPEEMRTWCFISLGRDASAYAPGDDAKGIELCGRVAASGQPSCITGLVKNRVDVTADADDGFRLCRRVTDEALAGACYRAVGSQVWLLNATAEARGRACAAGADGAWEAECRRGAGLPAAETPRAAR